MAANVSVSWSGGPHPGFPKSRSLPTPPGLVCPFSLYDPRWCGCPPASLCVLCLCLLAANPSVNLSQPVQTPFVRIPWSSSSSGRYFVEWETQEVLLRTLGSTCARHFPAALPFIPSYRLGPWSFQICGAGRYLGEGASPPEGWGSRYRPGGAVQQGTDRAFRAISELPALDGSVRGSDLFGSRRVRMTVTIYLLLDFSSS